MASYGHIRELDGLNSITYTPSGSISLKYRIIPEKKARVSALRKAVKNADQVILATDDDREGEAIAWHIREALKLPKKTLRIVFHEITGHAIREALSSARTVDMPTVYAQQAREIIDLTVGFRVSPALWQLVSRRTETGLSAGRCQTPALRLVAENDVEVKNAKGQVVYAVSGIFTKLSIPFTLDKAFKSTEETEDFLKDAGVFRDYVFRRGPVRRLFESPPLPFTTSTIQQAASSKLRMSPKATMRACQTLYEAGHITYMRTDSSHLAPEFVQAAAGTVRMKHGDAYIGSKLEELSKRGGASESGAQEAHEAIRPTHVGRMTLGDAVEPQESKVYDIIWRRAVGACMSSAELRRLSVMVQAPSNTNFKAVVTNIVFPGWQILSGPPEDSREFRLISAMRSEVMLPPNVITASASLRGTKQRYSEAALVQKLEALGIGRPSTFASLISKIQERNYVRVQDVPGRKVHTNEYRLEMGERIPSISLVEKTLGTEKRKLVLQPLGKIVIDVLSQHFAPLFDYGYTAEMEGRLDSIGNGSEKWETVCMACRDSVSELLAPLGDVQNKGIVIDDQHTYIVGKHGPVIKKTLENGEVSFLPTKPDIDMDRLMSSGGCTLEDVVRPQAGPISLGRHKDHTVTLKTGRYGPYVEWNDIRRSVNVGPEKSYTEITLKDVLPVLSDSGGRGEIRKLDRYTSIRSGPRGDYIFHKQPRWKRPKFYPLAGFVRTHGPDEYKTCGIKTLSAWLLKEHKLKLVA